jgi:hypothetical protein
MNRLSRYAKSTSFHLRWCFMSREERYAYLWGKTRKLDDLAYDTRNTLR